MYLVTGATGNVGAELVAQLAAAGEPVRAVVRDPGRARARLPEGVEAVGGDLNEPESLAGALDGVRGMFLLPGYDGLEELLALAKRAGVERVALLSGGSVDTGDLTNAVARYMIMSERAVEASGLDGTFLRCRAFMSNALRWLPQLREGDVVRVPFAGVPIAAVDPHDIAAVAAAALTGDGHAGKAYPLTGPAALLPAEQVAILGRALGRDLTCVAQPNDEARAEMEAAMPVEYVNAFFSFYVDGTLDETTVYPTVEEVTGRPPRTFEQWAAAHAADFS
jgi:uncharacterized protein YbjT (DUF2867 family)